MFLAKKCSFVVSAENTFLWVWRKNTFLRFEREKCIFAVLAGKVFSTRKVFFHDFDGKVFFVILAGKAFSRFWWENCVFRFWREIVFF